MEPQLIQKVEQLLERLQEVETELSQPETVSDQKRYREITREHRYLSDVQEVWGQWKKAAKQLEDNIELSREEQDPDLVELLKEDTQQLEEETALLAQKLESLLVPPDPNDHCTTILEIRAGTGGDEAALFVGDCVRMYKLFADKQGWKYDELGAADAEVGGYKEYVMALSGENVHRFLQYEAGTHRVQRIPTTESQGRIHTSAITVAALLEPDENTDVNIDEKDLRIDTYRSSGAGGQHVNTTDSAVRITHIPTGTVAYCQAERSQHKNRDKAMRLLKAKIAEEEARKKAAELASERASQVGSGDRSERIRTYNFPQNRITDHRINLTLYNLDAVMEGTLQGVVEPLVRYFHKVKLGEV